MVTICNYFSPNVRFRRAFLFLSFFFILEFFYVLCVFYRIYFLSKKKCYSFPFAINISNFFFWYLEKGVAYVYWLFRIPLLTLLDISNSRFFSIVPGTKKFYHNAEFASASSQTTVDKVANIRRQTKKHNTNNDYMWSHKETS